METKNLNKNKVDIDRPDSLGSFFIEFIKNINFTIGLLLFLFYIYINSTYFISNILSKINSDALNGLEVTDTGIFIQALLLTTFYILLDAFLS